MTSIFDFDDALNAAYTAKTAGKNLVTAKHEVLTKTGEFLFLAHTDKEFALRCQMVEVDIESAARRKMASVSDSKFKLVRALHEEWKIRHANCTTCIVEASTADKDYDGDGKLESSEEEHAGAVDRAIKKEMSHASKAVEKIAALEERLAPREAMSYSPTIIKSPFISKGGANSELSTIANDPEHQRSLADPKVAAEHKEGDYVLIHKYNPDGSHKDVTLGRLLGGTKGGSPDLSDVNCTGDTHEGFPNCNCGGRHYHVAEIGAMNPAEMGNHIFPANVVEDSSGNMHHHEAPEATGFIPAHHITALPAGNSEAIHDFLDQHAQAFGYDINGKHPLHDAESTKDQGAFAKILGYARKKSQGRFKNITQIVGYTTNRSTPTYGYTEDLGGGPRSEAKDSYQLEHGPRDFSGTSDRDSVNYNPEHGAHLDPSAAGSGKILPILHGAFRKQSKGGTRLTRMLGGGSFPDGSGTVPAGMREESRIGSFGTEHEAGRIGEILQPATEGADNQDWKTRQDTFSALRRRGIGGAGAANPTSAPNGGKVPNFSKMFGPKATPTEQ